MKTGKKYNVFTKIVFFNNGYQEFYKGWYKEYFQKRW